MKLKSFFVFVLMFVGTFLFSTEVSGVVSGVWTAQNSPYMVVGDITIPANESLNIQTGVEVVFQGNYSITALGRILAIGTETDSIRFYGNQQWDKIRLEDEAMVSEFVHCVILGADIGLQSVSSPLYLYKSRVGNISDTGIRITGFSNHAEVVISHSKIHNVVKSGINVTQNSNTLIEYNEITRCGTGPQFFGAIHLQSQSGENNPQIYNNHIHHNSKQGINAWDITSSSQINPVIMYNLIERNLTGIYLNHASGVISHNVIRDNFIAGNPNSGAGVMLAGASCQTIVSNNIVTGNFVGFYIGMQASPVLGDISGMTSEGHNVIMNNVGPDNTINSIYLFNTDVSVSAHYNLFHSDDPAVIAESIFDSNDNANLGTVHFEPYLVGSLVSGTAIFEEDYPSDNAYILVFHSLDGEDDIFFYSDSKDWNVIADQGLYFISMIMLDNLFRNDLLTDSNLKNNSRISKEKYNRIISQLRNTRMPFKLGVYGDFEEPTPFRVGVCEHYESIDIVLEDFNDPVYAKIVFGDSFSFNGNDIFPLKSYEPFFQFKTEELFLFDGEDDYVYIAGIRYVNIYTDQWEDIFFDDASKFIKARNVELYDQWETIMADHAIVRDINDHVQIDLIDELNGQDIVIARLYFMNNVGLVTKKIFDDEYYGFEEFLTIAEIPEFEETNSLMPLHANITYLYNNIDLYEFSGPTSFKILQDGFAMWDPVPFGYEYDEYRIYKNGEIFYTTQMSITYLQLNPEDLTGSWYVVAYNEYDSEESLPSNVITFTNITDEINYVKPQLKVNSYPNPFNFNTNNEISFKIELPTGLSKNSNNEVSIDIFNIKGQKVGNLFTGKLDAKNSSLIFSKEQLQQMKLSSGVYFYRVKANENSTLKKMLIIK